MDDKAAPYLNSSIILHTDSMCRLDTLLEHPEPELFKETKLNVDCDLGSFVTEQVLLTIRCMKFVYASCWSPLMACLPI